MFDDVPVFQFPFDNFGNFSRRQKIQIDRLLVGWCERRTVFISRVARDYQATNCRVRMISIYFFLFLFFFFPKIITRNATQQGTFNFI